MQNGMVEGNLKESMERSKSFNTTAFKQGLQDVQTQGVVHRQKAK